jgi:hypothetical protein
VTAVVAAAAAWRRHSGGESLAASRRQQQRRQHGGGSSSAAVVAVVAVLAVAQRWWQQHGGSGESLEAAEAMVALRLRFVVVVAAAAAAWRQRQCGGGGDSGGSATAWWRWLWGQQLGGSAAPIHWRKEGDLYIMIVKIFFYHTIEYFSILEHFSVSWVLFIARYFTSFGDTIESGRSQLGLFLGRSLHPPFPPLSPTKNNLKYFYPCISPFSFSHFFFLFPTKISNFPLVFWLAFQSQIETSSSHLSTTIPEYDKTTILTDNKYCHHVPYPLLEHHPPPM